VTLISSIIADAYREGNLIAIGRDPSDAQVTEGLRLLNQLFSAVFGDEAGEALRDWPLGTYGQETPDTSLTVQQRAHPNINRRLLALNEEAVTVYLTPGPQDGSRMGISDPFGRLATYPVTLAGPTETVTPYLPIVTSEFGSLGSLITFISRLSSRPITVTIRLVS